MEKEEQKQIEGLIAKSNKILVTTRSHADFDEVATGLAWLSLLNSQDKDVDLVIDADNLNRFDWLPESNKIKLCQHQEKRFVIKVKTDQTKLAELSYEVKEDHLEIYLTPKEGKISSEHIEHQENSFDYDLIIALGAKDLQALGEVYDDYREGFHNTPIISISNRPDTSEYGQINLIELTATSLAEVSFPFFENALTKQVAHYLLTSMISATQSFQTPKVRPKTLEIASRLIEAGAPREEIVMCLYRNKDLNTLKQWGVMLSRLEQKGNIAYTSATHEDFDISSIDWTALANELILASQTADIAVLFYQTKETNLVYVFAKEQYDLLDLLQQYEPKGRRRQVKFEIAGESQQITQQILDLLDQKLKMIRS